MNTTQVQSAVTSVILGLGGFLVGKGWTTAADLGAFASSASALIGALLVIVPFVHKLYTASTNARIAQVNATPGVKVVSEYTYPPAVTSAPPAGGGGAQ